jgi:hypothetical protein
VAIWALLAVHLIGYVLQAIEIGVIRSGSLSEVDGLLVISRIIYWLGFVYHMIVRFMIRNALNEVLERYSPQLKRFGGWGTFFFGSLYLQHRINQRVKERSEEVEALQYAGVGTSE